LSYAEDGTSFVTQAIGRVASVLGALLSGAGDLKTIFGLGNDVSRSDQAYRIWMHGPQYFNAASWANMFGPYNPEIPPFHSPTSPYWRR
jgi:hypothetical protein